LKEEKMTRRPYAVGVAILVTLLLSSAFGAAIEWVDVNGGTNLKGAIAPPSGTEARIQSTSQANPPAPPPPNLYAMPLDYVYIEPEPYGPYPGNMYPWYPWVSGWRFQMLYPASDIGRSGTIAQIAWKLFVSMYYDPETGTNPNTSIKLCHTPLADLTTDFNGNYGGNTPVWVYHDDAYTHGGVGNAWDTIDLTTPFEYNGTDNLLVEVVWMGSGYSNGPYGPAVWQADASPRLTRAYRYEITDTLVPTAIDADPAYYLMRIGFFKCGTPDPWCGDMLTQGYWKNHPCYDPKHPDAPYIAKFLPVMVAGQEVNTIPEALAIFNPPKPMTAWKMFLIQLLAAKLNAGWQTYPSLVKAWYDYPGGDYPFDNQRVFGILDVADDYTTDTDKAMLNEMKDVLENMNCYRDKGNGCLWDAMWSPGDGPEGQATALPAKPELSVVPSVAKSGNVRIAYALPKATPAQLTVLDVAGRTVMTRALSAAVGDHIVSLDAGSLDAGVYIVRITGADLTLSRKLVVQR
jgi:hypothetical protein